MKGFSLNLIVFATIFLLSSALPEDKTKDHYKTLVESEENKENAKFLERRKPPGKIPGPTLNFEERDSWSLASTPHDGQSKMKHLSDKDKRKKEKKDINLKKYNNNIKKDDLARKDKDVLRGDRYDSDPKEETQEEKKSPLIY